MVLLLVPLVVVVAPLVVMVVMVVLFAVAVAAAAAAAVVDRLCQGPLEVEHIAAGNVCAVRGRAVLCRCGLLHVRADLRSMREHRLYDKFLLCDLLHMRAGCETQMDGPPCC